MINEQIRLYQWLSRKWHLFLLQSSYYCFIYLSFIIFSAVYFLRIVMQGYFQMRNLIVNVAKMIANVSKNIMHSPSSNHYIFMCNKRFYTAIFFHAKLLYEAILDFCRNIINWISLKDFVISIFCTSLFLIYASLNDNALKEINGTMYLYRTTSNNVR